MIRFIAKHVIRDFGHVSEGLETIDLDLPELEAWLSRGGRGGGPDNDDFEYVQLIGAEVKKD